MNKMYYGNLFVRIILFLLFISSIIIFYERQITQLNDMYVNAENIKTDLESNIQGGIVAVKYLNTSAQLILDNKKTMPLKFAPLVEEYNSKGNYTADHVFDKNIANEDKANISGYGGLKKDRLTLQEMEMSLSLIRYFKLIKEQNKNYAWVYYYSYNDFVTLYPFVESKDFVLLPEYKNKPLMTYATPEMNPNKELFFTPLYIDNGGLGLMVTLGMPLYDKEKFLGATELDMTLESQSMMLKRLDYLQNNSVVINKENEIIAINTIAKPNTKEIIKIDSLVGNKIVNLQDTQGAVSLIDGKYVYIKKFTNAPWKLIYYKNSSEVILQSFFASLPPLLTMAFIFYFYKIYQRMQELSIELKEQVAHRKIQADLLRKKSAEFRSFVENSPDVIIRYDCEGRRIYVNPSAEKLFGLPANEIVGKTPLDGSPNPSDVMFMEKLQTVIQTKIPFEFESEFTTSTGEKRWENYRIFPEFDLNRNIISVLSIGRDITEHKKNEDLFNLKQSRLAQMGEMISMIAHQWRQPLGAISTTAGSIELKIDLQTFDLETKEGRDKQNLYFKERLKKIRGFVEILTTTIDDFRSFYKPNKKSVTTSFELLIIKVMSIMKSSLDNDNIELIYNYNSHEEMEMHDSEMMQVILNIFKNAQDNFKEKQIKNPIITITTFEKTLSICDNGSGIPNEIIEKIFDPYFSTKSEKNGTGLGLYMSKIIIEEHHKGTLDAINVDDGVCFKINLTKEK